MLPINFRVKIELMELKFRFNISLATLRRYVISGKNWRTYCGSQEHEYLYIALKVLKNKLTHHLQSDNNCCKPGRKSRIKHLLPPITIDGLIKLDRCFEEGLS